MQLLIKSALERNKHFQYALSLFDEYLAQNTQFQQNFLKLVESLNQTEHTQNTTGKVFLIAIGKSAGVARLAASMFVSVGLPVQFLHPTEAFHGDFGIVNPKDTVVFISNNGNSTELLQLIPGLLERTVTMFCITAKPQSPLAQQSHHVLQIPPVDEKCPLYQSPLTSTVTSLALCQLLVAATIEQRNFSVESYAKNHPGGTIGKRIFLKVDDIMSKDDDLPIIGPNANFQTLVSLFTSFAKACLIVTDENKNFLGLIAERDLRKSMEKYGPKVFEKTSKDIMNQKPISIESGTLALEALKIMTQKKPYLNVLPVISKANKAVGIIQIQDVLGLNL